MRHIAIFLICLSALLHSSAQAAEIRLIKVLPQYLDLQGKHALAPSLYERDAYQAYLLDHPLERSGLVFNVQWKLKGSDASHLKVKVETRSTLGKEIKLQTFEQPITKKGWLSTWSKITLNGETYKNFGELVAWRATLWDADKQVAEQKSFLW